MHSQNAILMHHSMAMVVNENALHHSMRTNFRTSLLIFVPCLAVAFLPLSTIVPHSMLSVVAVAFPD